MSRDRYLDLISGIHGAAFEPSTWPSVMGAIAEFFDAAGAGCMVVDPTTKIVEWAVMSGPTLHLLDHYTSQIAVDDPFVDFLSAHEGQTVLLSDALTKDQLGAHSWYGKILRQAGIADAIGVAFGRTPEHAVFFGLQLASGRSKVSHPGRLQHIIRHLEQAILMSGRLRRLRSRAMVASEIVDRLPSGVIVVDRNGRIVEINCVAERIVTRGDALLIRKGVLHARRDSQTKQLRETLLRGETVHLQIGRDGGKAPYMVTVAPLGQDPATQLSLLFVGDPDESPSSQKRVTDFFRLSPAEGRLAAGLLEGKRLPEIAAGAGVQITTLRTQLSSLLKKVGVERQSDLVRVLTSTRLVEPLEEEFFGGGGHVQNTHH